MGRRLRITEIRQLQELGHRARLEEPLTRRGAEIEAARLAVNLKSTGVRYTEIALTLGIPDARLKRWRQTHSPKTTIPAQLTASPAGLNLI